jgi:hypothetical protein
MAETVTFGAQRLTVEAPDIIRIDFRGTLDGPAARELLGWLSAWCQGKSRFYILCDMTESVGVSADARRTLQSFAVTFPATRVACWGWSFTMRVLVEMLSRARRLLGVKGPRTPPRFFASEREARAFIEAERRRPSIPPAG